MNEELEKMLKEMNESYKKLAETSISATDLKVIKDSVDAAKKLTVDEVEKLNNIVVEQAKALKELKENGGSGSYESEEKQVKNFFTENIDEIKKLYKNQQTMSFDVDAEKAVGNITTASGVYIEQPRALGPVSNANMRSANLVNYATISNTNLPSIPYVDTIPKDGLALEVAEGDAKPQVDFKHEIRFSNVTKAAAYEVITEEASQDVVGLMSVAKHYLKKRHDIAFEKAVYFGDGVGANTEGATVLARLFNAGAMALKVPAPNFSDIIMAGIVDIQTTHNYADEDSYRADIVMVSPIDFYLEYITAKDTTGRPLYPLASTYGSVVIGGVTVVPTERIPDGKIFVADMSMYNIKKYKGYKVTLGWHNDDFIKNQFVMLGESRYHAYVKFLDKAAFLYDDIETIRVAITKAA